MRYLLIPLSILLYWGYMTKWVRSPAGGKKRSLKTKVAWRAFGCGSVLTLCSTLLHARLWGWGSAFTGWTFVYPFLLALSALGYYIAVDRRYELSSADVDVVKLEYLHREDKLFFNLTLHGLFIILGVYFWHVETRFGDMAWGVPHSLDSPRRGCQ